MGSPLSNSGESARSRVAWRLLPFLFLLYIASYLDRTNVGIAALQMNKAIGLNAAAYGFGASIFFIGYALFEVPSGWLADRFGPRLMLARIVIWWSAMTAATGLVVGFVSLFAVRFLFGVGEAGAFPIASRGMQLWFPRVERGRIQGTTHFFSRFAVAITPFIAGSILLAFGWRAIFYIFGSLGIVWAIAFTLFYRNVPEDHSHSSGQNYR